MSFLALLQKELRHYFNSPIAYVLLIAFLLMSGGMFASYFFLSKQANMNLLFSLFPMFFIFFAPALSMRLFAEEKRQGTFESLVTLPVSDMTIAGAKYIASIILVLVILLLTWICPLMISTMGPLEWGVTITGYIGIFIMVATLLSIGMFISSLTRNQIVAFIISVVIAVVLLFAGNFSLLFPEPFGGIVDYIGFQSHLNAFLRGVIDLRDILYFGSLITVMLLLTKESMAQRHA